MNELLGYMYLQDIQVKNEKKERKRKKKNKNKD